MIQGLITVGVAVLVLAEVWLLFRVERWRKDHARVLQQVAELKAHDRLLEDHSSQAIIKFESTGAIRGVNVAAEKLFGYAAGELVGQDISKLTPSARFGPRIAEKIEITCKNGSILELPFTPVRSELIKRPNVHFFYIYLFFGETGNSDGKIAAPASDLSRAATIVGRIAGQYETMLTTINGYSELALMETPEGSPARQKIEEILTASERASDLTQQLVAFSGRQFIPIEKVELNRVVMDMLTSLQCALPCPIDCDLQPTDQALLANVDFLKQVILLLCSSASGRMAETDRLQIRTGQCDLTEPLRVQSGELKPGTYGAITISDSGRPLSAAIKEHLFEPLSQIHQDIGVDLSPIYGIVQGLGGGIDLVMGDDIGTTFEILLPCMPATPSDARITEDHLAQKLPA
jgi:nitrogen-specific signal transduction histidine kinase